MTATSFFASIQRTMIEMADGQTTFQFASRADLRRALDYQPGGDEKSVRCWVKWNPGDTDWQCLRAGFVRKHSVMFVVAAKDIAISDADLPAKQTADHRRERYETKAALSEASA